MSTKLEAGLLGYHCVCRQSRSNTFGVVMALQHSINNMFMLCPNNTQIIYTYIHRESKKRRHYILVHIFAKY